MHTKQVHLFFYVDFNIGIVTQLTLNAIQKHMGCFFDQEDKPNAISLIKH